jgi:hypothetical protein
MHMGNWKDDKTTLLLQFSSQHALHSWMAKAVDKRAKRRSGPTVSPRL